MSKDTILTFIGTSCSSETIQKAIVMADEAMHIFLSLSLL